MKAKKINLLHAMADAYEAPSILMVDISPEGVLCESNRDIDNFDVLPEQDW